MVFGKLAETIAVAVAAVAPMSQFAVMHGTAAVAERMRPAGGRRRFAGIYAGRFASRFDRFADRIPIAFRRLDSVFRWGSRVWPMWVGDRSSGRWLVALLCRR